ncbi:MAG TPA: hypothetical protein VLU99_06775, partial [Nitrososphaerales archaeon]|nr:hypothetical protein [Nitrososphaerales archaeon]
VVVVAAVAIFYLSFMYQIPVDHINTRSQIPQGLYANPVFAAVATNTTGDVSLSLSNFNYTSPDGTTQLKASSGSIQITITPAGQNETNLNMTLNLNGVNIKSPSYTGSFSSLKLTGYVVVNPQTNQLVVSLVASTSVASIVQSVLGV